MSIKRCYVEKKPGFDIAVKHLQSELSDVLGLSGIAVRLFNRYDVEGVASADWAAVTDTVLSEPASDNHYGELPDLPESRLLYIEPLPGQFDMRADSCEQCIQMLLGGERPIVRTAKVYALGGVDGADFERVKSYLINPLEYREAGAGKPDSLARDTEKSTEEIPSVKITDGTLSELGLAMSQADLAKVKEYFSRKEKRNPTLTELRVIDTYWSDHCRHTTFNTVIRSADIEDKRVRKAYELFLAVNGDKPATLMNIATAAMRHLRKKGGLSMLDVSEENNACTIRVKNNNEDWLLFFKNETHNHPTEIEPFGGASTCIGGAIRDPLSGRAYVYQSMRISGAGNPLKPIEETLSGKLPQRKLTVTAAEGFSSYGNQIGLATGLVKEVYHDGYVAKRLETGAVVGAAPLSSVRRERPAHGDIVMLLGGRTGRDGIGGATGSSKTHTADTVTESAAEVQKGNAPEERKLQRLFRDPKVTSLIKRCNDFGAGGASVAIGELADGVEIDLNSFPLKYEGLNGTEIAVSESQERMAVVISAQDVNTMFKYAEAENIEATIVAKITEQKRLCMVWNGNKIVDISREFLDTNGAERYADVKVEQFKESAAPASETRQLNNCSQKGLVERFDSSVGAGSVFSPFGGEFALTESQVMAALLPSVTGVASTQNTNVAGGACADGKTASVMAHGFDPYYTERDCFGGAAFAVVNSVAKLISAGVPLDTIHLTLQEFFPRLEDVPDRWGKPFSAMLGAFYAQMGLGIAAIGGKDSMSGSFGELDVPPTLISFAVGVCDASVLISSEFKQAGNPVYVIPTCEDYADYADYIKLRIAWEKYTDLVRRGKVLSARVGGAFAITEMAFGNMIGFDGEIPDNMNNIIFEAGEELSGYKLIGLTRDVPEINGVSLAKLREKWEQPLESVFPVKVAQSGKILANAGAIADERRHTSRRGMTFAKPKAIIPTFPGTNCEYDTAAAVERAGGVPETVLVRNLTPNMLKDSIIALERAISSAQMIVFPGGFAGGDEPDGSAKFIVSLFSNPRLADAVHKLVKNKDGLMLGICNGFQALVKLGLLPYGEISPATDSSPTLTFNSIGRHQSQYVKTRVASVRSPWLAACNVGEVYVQPISHGEGRFAANPETLEDLMENGQIVFRYDGFNPNGSDWDIEGICSPDGRILGKMAHSERAGEHIAKNVPGNKFLPIFESGVKYFK